MYETVRYTNVLFRIYCSELKSLTFPLSIWCRLPIAQSIILHPDLISPIIIISNLRLGLWLLSAYRKNSWREQSLPGGPVVTMCQSIGLPNNNLPTYEFAATRVLRQIAVLWLLASLHLGASVFVLPHRSLPPCSSPQVTQ